MRQYTHKKSGLNGVLWTMSMTAFCVTLNTRDLMIRKVIWWLSGGTEGGDQAKVSPDDVGTSTIF